MRPKIELSFHYSVSEVNDSQDILGSGSEGQTDTDPI